MSKLRIRDKRGTDRYFVDNDLIKQFGKELGPYGVSIYNVIAMHADNDTQDAYPSYQTIANYLGISRRKVISTIEQMAELGIISITERTHTGTKYRKSNVITLLHKSEWGREVTTRHSAPDAPYSESDAPYIVNDTHQHSAPGAPKLNSLTKPNRTKLKEGAEKPPHPPAAEIYREVFEFFPKSNTWPDLERVTDCKRFAAVCNAWRLQQHNPKSITGLLDWYDYGIPEHAIGGKQNGPARAKATKRSVNDQAGRAGHRGKTGGSGGGAARGGLSRADIKQRGEWAAIASNFGQS